MYIMDEFNTDFLTFIQKEDTVSPVYSPSNPQSNQTNSFLDLKRKRNSDSLESLEDLEKTSHLINSEQNISHSGINFQLIAKNDKKLVKLNLAKDSTNTKDSIDRIKSIFTLASPESKNTNQNKLLRLEDIDDLPSESDVSAGLVIFPSIQSPNKNIECVQNLENSFSVCFKCDSCLEIFNDEKSFRCHRKSHHSNEMDSILNEISEHIEKEEEKIQSSKSRKKIFICTECGNQFYSQNDLNKHMLHVHENSKPYKCSQCPMTFVELSTKNRHEKEHLGLKPFRCYICAFEFSRASNLRTHLLKVHPNDIGTLVNITKSDDNKLKFEFNLDAIQNNRQQIQHSKSSKSSSKSFDSKAMLNTVIYIKDPNNKNSDIQHMVVYIDGKPIFVQNPKLKNSETGDAVQDAQVPKSSNYKLIKNKSQSSSNKSVTKIPYLLAAAAAAAVSNQKKVDSSQKINVDLNQNFACQNQELKHDQDYLQLVSMFKQKNQKLHNPLKGT